MEISLLLSKPIFVEVSERIAKSYLEFKDKHNFLKKKCFFWIPHFNII